MAKERSFADVVRINPNNLEEELTKQPMLFTEYSMEYVLADAREKQAKVDLEAVEADLYLQIRQQKIDSGEKFTEKLLESEVKKSDVYKDAMKKLIEAQTAKQVAKMKVEALNQRKDMLIQLSAMSRAELNNMVQ